MNTIAMRSAMRSTAATRSQSKCQTSVSIDASATATRQAQNVVDAPKYVSHRSGIKH